LDFPFLDPLLFEAGGTFSISLGVATRASDLFIVPPETRSSSSSVQ
jgi:hypothetical protein